MRGEGLRNLRLGLLAAAIVFALDLATKQAALVWLAPVAPVPVTGFLNLVLVWNPGVSFGMLQGLGALGPWLLTGFAVAICAGLLVWLARDGRPATRLGIGLVLGGALGNIVDRLRFGAVLDFLDFHAIGYHWPAFNVADSAIVVGAGLLLLDGLRQGRGTQDVRGQIQ